MRVFLGMTSKPDGATTPFLRVTKVFPEDTIPGIFIPEITRLRGHVDYDVVPQFMACDPDNFLRACELLPPDIPFIELNCGCPTPNAAGRTAGSGILENPDEFLNTIDYLCTKLGPKRLAVKMRIGFNEPDEFSELLAVADLPIARLAIHGRTRKERYTGFSRWNLIDQASKKAQVEVLGSGDVFGATSMRQHLQTAPDIAGVFIGRGLLQNPWIFTELKTETSVQLTPASLIYALCSFALLNELTLQKPEKMLHSIGEKRIGTYCGIEEGLWESSTLALMSTLSLPPTVISRDVPFPSLRLLPVTFARVRTLWAYMRKAVPIELAETRILKTKTMDDFTSEIWNACQNGQLFSSFKLSSH